MDIIKEIKRLQAQQREQERTKEQVKNLLLCLGFVVLVSLSAVLEEILNLGV